MKAVECRVESDDFRACAPARAAPSDRRSSQITVQCSARARRCSAAQARASSLEKGARLNCSVTSDRLRFDRFQTEPRKVFPHPIRCKRVET
jgi:hypothetical protein